MGSSTRSSRESAPGYLDAAGATASFLCAIHCALMPLVVGLLPLVGLSFLANEATEWALIGSSAVLGTTSLCWGYREHRSRRAMALLAAGLALLALGRFAHQRGFDQYGVGMLVVGGLTIAAAHLVNRRLCQSCRVCHKH